MIAPSSHETWLFYSPPAQQAARLKDDLLDPVDQLLDDPALVDLVRQCLAKHSPRSTRTGRRGMAADRLLRCCVMKHTIGGHPTLLVALSSTSGAREKRHHASEQIPARARVSRRS